MSGVAFIVGNAGFFQEIVANRVAPDDRVTRLIFQASEYVIKPLRIDVALQRFPLIDKLGNFGGAFIVGIVDVLNDSFSRVEFVCIRNVMEEEQKLVGRGRERFVDFRDWRTILADESGAGRDGAVHADSLFVGAMPLSPAVFFGGLDVRAVVAAGDVGEGLRAERAGVIFVSAP